MDSQNHKFLGFIFALLVGFSVSIGNVAEASAPNCQSLFEESAKTESSSSGQLLNFLENVSSYDGRSTLGLQKYLQSASWWQTKRLLWKIRKLKGSDILTTGQIDKMISDVFRITQLQRPTLKLRKNPAAEALRIKSMPDQLIKDQFDQALAKEGLLKALSKVSRLRPSRFELQEHRSLTRAGLFTLLTAIGVTGKMGLHPFGMIDPYMPDVDVLRDKMLIEDLVALADEKGYDQALEQLQMQFLNVAQKQRFYHVFKSVYHWSGKVFAAAFIVGHAYSLYQDHEQTIEHRLAVAAAVSKIVPPEEIENLRKKITDPHRLGAAVFDEYFAVLHAQNASIDKHSDEMLEVRGEIIQNMTEQLANN